MKANLNKIILISLVMLFLLPLVDGYWSTGFYPWRPADLLENEWVIFIALFAIFYTTIFFSLEKVFKDNKVAPAIIAVALAFLVTAGIQRNWMFLERPIMFWALILTIILVLLTFFRAMSLGPGVIIGLILLLIGSWPIYRKSLGIRELSALPYGFIRFLDSVTPIAWILFIVSLVFIIKGLFKQKE